MTQQYNIMQYLIHMFFFFLRDDFKVLKALPCQLWCSLWVFQFDFKHFTVAGKEENLLSSAFVQVQRHWPPTPCFSDARIPQWHMSEVKNTEPHSILWGSLQCNCGARQHVCGHDLTTYHRGSFGDITECHSNITQIVTCYVKSFC